MVYEIMFFSFPFKNIIVTYNDNFFYYLILIIFTDLKFICILNKKTVKIDH